MFAYIPKQMCHNIFHDNNAGLNQLYTTRIYINCQKKKIKEKMSVLIDKILFFFKADFCIHETSVNKMIYLVSWMYIHLYISE